MTRPTVSPRVSRAPTRVSAAQRRATEARYRCPYPGAPELYWPDPATSSKLERLTIAVLTPGNLDTLMSAHYWLPDGATESERLESCNDNGMPLGGRYQDVGRD